LSFSLTTPSFPFFATSAPTTETEPMPRAFRVNTLAENESLEAVTRWWAMMPAPGKISVATLAARCGEIDAAPQDKSIPPQGHRPASCLLAVEAHKDAILRPYAALPWSATPRGKKSRIQHDGWQHTIADRTCQTSRNSGAGATCRSQIVPREIETARRRPRRLMEWKTARRLRFSADVGTGGRNF